jgi:hypothetical protein
MAYRNGTYIAFHADGNNQPGKTDIDYYNLMKAWTAKSDDDFTMINSHEKTAAVRDTSKVATLRARLFDRLKNSKNMVLIIGETTKNARVWVPFEIEQAVDLYGIPIIAAYTGYTSILAPADLRSLWPPALAQRIDNKTAHVIHIPFKKAPLLDAIPRFDHNNYPNGGGLGHYSREAQESWGLR